MAANPKGPGAALKGAIFKSMYRVYLWSFRGSEETYDVSERIVEYPFAIRELSRLPAHSKVVLIGCHGDFLSTLLASQGLEVHGVDVKDFPLHYENFTFHRQDVRHLDFENGSFDAAVAISTVEHVGLFDDDPEGDRKAIGELRRVLKPGGLLVITVPFGAAHTVIPLRERVYDRSTLTALLDGFDVTAMSAYTYRPATLWTPIPIDQAPAAGSYTTNCTVLVRAMRSGTGAASATPSLSAESG